MKSSSAILGGGCFWCLEAVFQEVKGITKVTNGYAGGEQAEPTYEQVCGGGTGHAEVVQLEFDAAVISYADILEIFFGIHDPTTLNRQGNDRGPQYRSIILYQDDEQKAAADKAKAAAQKLWDDPIVTEIKPLIKFWPAEDYHQNYFRTHPDQAYCQVIINPKLAKFRQHFASRLKS